MSVFIEGRCFDDQGSNSSTLYVDGNVEWFDGTECHPGALVDSEALDTTCQSQNEGEESAVWFTYTAPTMTPTQHPSRTPTIKPSKKPSQVPSVQPSAAPSIYPSMTPSAVPSTSFNPTVKNSVQNDLVLRFNSYATLTGLLSPDLTENAKDAMVSAVCVAMDLPPTSCLSQQFFALSDSNATVAPHSADKHEETAYWKVVLTVGATVYMVDFPDYQRNTTALYNDLATSLLFALNYGQFAQLLRDNAVTYDAPELLSLTITTIELDQPEVQQPPTWAPTHGPGLSNADRAGAIVGGVFGAIFIMLSVCCICWFVVGRKKKQRRQSRDVDLVHIAVTDDLNGGDSFMTSEVAIQTAGPDETQV